MDRKDTARLLASMAALGGLVVLAGWVFHLPFLLSLRPDWVTMKTTTALSFILSGILLFMIWQTDDFSDLVISSCSLLLFLLMLSLLGSFFSAWIRVWKTSLRGNCPEPSLRWDPAFQLW